MLFSFGVFFQNQLFKKKSFRNTMQVPNNLDTDHIQYFIGWLLSADDKSSPVEKYVVANIYL